MNFQNIVLISAEIFVGLGLFFFGGGYLLSKWKGGTKESQAESKDLISSNDQIKEFYKNQNEDLKSINKELTGKIDGLTREVGEVRGQLNAETAAKKEYLAILQNRDPETKKFMEYMIQAVRDQAESHQAMMKIMGEIHTMSKAEHERDFKITATVSKDGGAE